MLEIFIESLKIVPCKNIMNFGTANILGKQSPAYTKKIVKSYLNKHYQNFRW